MRALPLRVLFVAIVISAAVPSVADSMRCGNKLVNSGDSSTAVRHLCGEPADIVQTVIARRPSYMRGGRVIFLGEHAVETPVETWTYNFGPNKLMHRLRFVDGILESIEALEYGHR